MVVPNSECYKCSYAIDLLFDLLFRAWIDK